MAVDVLRSCYRSKMRIDRNRPDLLVEMEYFFTPPGAKLCPFPTAFSSRNYTETNEHADLSLGEVEVTKRFVKGFCPPGVTGQFFCGDPSHAAKGCDLVNGPVVPLDPHDGVLLCCRGGVPYTWTFHATGGASWTTLGPYHIHIEWEDSQNCGGTNSDIQTGDAEITIISDEPQTVTVALTARIETQNAGFDGITLFVNGDEAYTHFSTEEGGSCAMEEFEDEIEIDLVEGANVIRVEFTTVDPLYHTDGFWDLDFLIPP